jgi:hypothetical protein
MLQDAPVAAPSVDLLKDAWMQTLRNRSGRRVIWDLLGISHFGLSGFTANNETTNFISGKQKVAEYIFQNIPPNIFYLMSTEAKEDLDYERRSKDGSDDGDQ